ncbi:hypothetical protein FDP41_013732 [Naegleria fowleri]|uniref:G-patch domain-containing protein n=1 Tax=Naegleria fowleri TaxID=5763 RepID=A0A6A5C3T2_NAEFO|nr:uncharacterized protein FDP41_013732 [Naegleria fowleri]KAF0980518.1 hypothetical protein FDP41_013732 [Naegleria fowleri]CAG4711397.1 unnamed protein product [Naegleria fowleri]
MEKRHEARKEEHSDRVHEKNQNNDSTPTPQNSESEMNSNHQEKTPSALDELFSSSSSDEEENKQNGNETSSPSSEDHNDYMNDKFLQHLSEQDEISRKNNQQSHHETKLSFYNAPPELLKQYNIAKKEKQHKKAHHLKKQIREYGIRESMLEKAKISLSQNLIKKEEEKSEASQSVGLKLLKKMGYETGHGLGKNKQGLINPLSIDRQLDDLIQTSAQGKTKNLPKIGSTQEDLQKKAQIEQFKNNMKEKSIGQKHQKRTLTPEEYKSRMKEIHDEQKKKRKLRMALQPSSDMKENPLKKQKEEENWDEFDDF